MSRMLDRVTLAASLLAPHVGLDWSRPRRRGATMISTARIGALSEVVIQSVEPLEDASDPCGGLSGWSRALQGDFDPFPIRFWAYTRLTDAPAWAGLRQAVHHRLLVLAQAHLLLSRRPLAEVMSGLRLVDADSARHAVSLLTGRDSRAEDMPGLIADLHRPPATGPDHAVRQS